MTRAPDKCSHYSCRCIETNKVKKEHYLITQDKWVLLTLFVSVDTSSLICFRSRSIGAEYYGLLKFSVRLLY